MSTVNMSDIGQLADNERLSAWLDGELRGEQSRFFAKRVEHDAALQEQAERWSLAGELLRAGAAQGSAVTMQAPHNFLDRVRVAIDQERALEREYVQELSAGVVSPQELTLAAPQPARLSVGARVVNAFNRPAAIAASLTLAASALLLSHFGVMRSEPVTSLAMQKVTLPEVKARNAATQRANASRVVRNANAVAARNAMRPQAVNRQVALPSRGGASSASPVLMARAAAPATVNSPNVVRLPDPMPRRAVANSALSAAVKPAVVASKNDPFGVGSNFDNRIMSGKPWPRGSVTGLNNRMMNASFRPESSGSVMPAQISLGAQIAN